MHLIEVTSDNKQQVDRFTLLPFSLYRGCAQWVPPLLSEARSLLDPRKHPFYQHSRAAFFLVESEGQALGRLAVMENRNHNAYRQAKTAFFGFFEVIEDRQASTALFEAAFAWARRSGLNRIIGPRGLIGADGGGILVEGFQHRPALGVPYNHPYYDSFIQQSGFEKDTDHLSGYLPGDHPLPQRLLKIAERVKQRRGYTIKSFSSKAEMKQWAPRVIAVHRAAFANTHTFYPPTQAEMDSIINTLIDVADPRLIKLLLKDEQVIGFIFAYHDFSAGLQKAGGWLWPFGWYHLLRDRSRPEWVDVNGVGLHPDHQGLGGNTVLYAELRKSLSQLGFKHIEVVQVNETNFTSRSDMEAIGVRWYKRHRSYQRDL
jgi:GNAT superfamily N-acetyltransferase